MMQVLHVLSFTKIKTVSLSPPHPPHHTLFTASCVSIVQPRHHLLRRRNQRLLPFTRQGVELRRRNRALPTFSHFLIVNKNFSPPPLPAPPLPPVISNLAGA